MRFHDRQDAGRRLAELLTHYRDQQPIVLGLPRGGVPVAYEIALALEAPLDTFVVRKIGAPFQPELGIGAIAEGGVVLLDERAQRLGITSEEIRQIERMEKAELERRVQRFRGGAPLVPVRGRTVILVDDGIATGGTARAAIQALRQLGVGRLVLAVPVIPAETVESFAREVDELVSLTAPEAMWAIGFWYEDFTQVTDEEVMALLERGRTAQAEGAQATAEKSPRPGTLGEEQPVALHIPGLTLAGDLAIPEGAQGIVLFAHGSGSSRRSPRNRYVARVLRQAGLATLLFDLLSEEEEALDEITSELRFDIPLLAERLGDATSWVRQAPRTQHLRVGYFGSSTGAAAALVAAAARPEQVYAVVSRGGRPDLAGPALPEVRAPTLLIVGGADHPVIGLNREAMRSLACERRLAIVPHATHLFEEPGTLEEVARLAANWFRDHLPAYEAEARV
jgi:putative phosphoribosyl transferase